MRSFLLESTFFTLLVPVFHLFAYPTSSQSARIKKNILRINLQVEPLSLDPRKGKDLACFTVLFMLFEGLTRDTPNSSTELALAKSIDISPNGKTYTFHLRDSKWSDGTNLEAYDFEFAWKESLRPDFPSSRAELFYPIKNAKAAKQGTLPLSDVGITATNAKTLVVQLEHPTSHFLKTLSSPIFLPVPHKHVLVNPNWMEPESPSFICNGPFILNRWQIKRQIRLKKNKNYWKADTVSLSRIDMSLVGDENTALQMYKKGELDLLGRPLTHIPLDAIPALLQENAINSSPIALTSHCLFNTKAFPFYNRHIRKAFAYAINRQAIVDHITKCGQIIATGIVAPVLKNNPYHQYHQDANTEAAKAYLKKGLEELNINLSELQNLVLIHPSLERDKLTSQVLQQQWNNVLGIQVRLLSNELLVCLKKLEQKDYQLAYLAKTTRYNDPMGILETFKRKEDKCNVSGWENSHYIQLLNDSFKCHDLIKREEMLKEAEKLLIDEQPIAPVYHDAFTFLKKSYLKGVHASPGLGLFYLEGAYFDQTIINQK